MKQLTKTLKIMLDALAYEDAGEYLTPRQKVDVLTQDPTTVIKPAPVIKTQNTDKPRTQTRRRIALYIGGRLPAEVIDYCLQTCNRLDHDLTVLTFETETMAERLLQPYQDLLESAGIDLELVTLTGEPLPRLKKFLRRRPDIAFMACKDAGYLGRGFIQGTQRTHALPVPVVVIVAQQAAAEARPEQTVADSEQQTGTA